MKSSAVARLALALALALTLGPKLLWSQVADMHGADRFLGRAETVLHAARFETRRVARPSGPVVVARRDACTMMVAEFPPHGTLAEPLADFARPIGPLRFAWNGRLSDAAPKVVPLFTFFAVRELRRAGFAPAQRPITAVAANAHCDLGGIDWAALASLPA